MMNGGSSFPSGKKAFSASREWGGITAAGAIAEWLLASLTTGVYEAGVGRDWEPASI